MAELVTRLRELIARDREIADIWERQCEEYWPCNPREDVPSPPERGRAAIRNWINWLRARADELDAALRVPEGQQAIDFSKITRVEVIDEQGRQFSRWSCSAEPSIQDDGRTLKLFIQGNSPARVPEGGPVEFASNEKCATCGHSRYRHPGRACLGSEDCRCSEFKPVREGGSVPPASPPWQRHIDDMRRASAVVDESEGAVEYQVRMVALALIARQFLRDLPEAPPASQEGEP